MDNIFIKTYLIVKLGILIYSMKRMAKNAVLAFLDCEN